MDSLEKQKFTSRGVSTLYKTTKEESSLGNAKKK